MHASTSSSTPGVSGVADAFTGPAVVVLRKRASGGKLVASASGGTISVTSVEGQAVTTTVVGGAARRNSNTGI